MHFLPHFLPLAGTRAQWSLVSEIQSACRRNGFVFEPGVTHAQPRPHPAPATPFLLLLFCLQDTLLGSFSYDGVRGFNKL